MDGQQKGVGASLQQRLSLWMALAIAGVAVTAGVLSYFTALQEARELQDDMLRQVLHLVQRQGVPTHAQPSQTAPDLIDSESEVVIQTVYPMAPSQNTSTLADIRFDAARGDGLQTVQASQQSWRVLVHTGTDGTRLLAAQRTTVRDEIARDAAIRAMVPLLVLMPLLVLICSVLVRAMFKPVRDLATELSGRTQEDLTAIPQDRIPDEILPFVASINALLGRVQGAMQMQRRFLADAAHELRTPLTALTLQAEQLASSDMPLTAQSRVQALMAGLARARQLVEQLLSYARVREARSDVIRPVSVRATTHRVIEDLMPLAQARNIDLGLVGVTDHAVRIPEADLRTLLANLVDNAIKYTPVGGKVDVVIRPYYGQVRLEVVDNGPGIEPPERERVLDPFYRVLGSDVIGSGLGLSIVHTITARIGATLELAYADEEKNTGLRASVTFPAGEDAHVASTV